MAGIAAREVLFPPPRMGALRKKLAAAKNRGYCIHSSGAVNAGILIQCSGFAGSALLVGGALKSPAGIQEFVSPDAFEQIACGIAITPGSCGSVLTSTLNQFSQIFAGVHDVPPKCVRGYVRIPFPADIQELPVSFARPVKVTRNDEMEPCIPVALHVQGL